jgi:hypothetical protein
MEIKNAKTFEIEISTKEIKKNCPGPIQSKILSV